MSDLAPGLYVVATPIGNLGDLTERAKAILAAAHTVAAEDTRTARIVLDRCGATPELVSLTEHNVGQRAGPLVDAARTAAVALVSDAGTPVLADPGARLVAAAHDAGVTVFAVPGPSALAAAVSVAGFEGSDVHFLGFLPRKDGERRRRLEAAARAAAVLAFYESPNRLAAALRAVAEALGDPLVAVCRELTKVHEEVVRGRASELAERFAETRGEVTVVVEVPEAARRPDRGEEARELLAMLRRAGAKRGAAAGEVARRCGITRAEAYAIWGEDGGEGSGAL